MAALDTREKRMAAVGVGRPFMRAVNAGNLGTTQRPSIGIAYAFDFEAPVVPPTTGGGTIHLGSIKIASINTGSFK